MSSRELHQRAVVDAQDAPTHTPGPWSYDQRWVSAGHGDQKIAICGMFYLDHAPRDEVEANMRLIATAPDLLEALQEAVEALQAIEETTEFPSLVGSALEAVSKAIAKATGQ
jgi:hypothetical protein